MFTRILNGEGIKEALMHKSNKAYERRESAKIRKIAKLANELKRMQAGEVRKMRTHKRY